METFFYASQDATFYDDTVRMTDRAYDLVHDVSIQVLQFWLLQRPTRSASGAPVSILDIGCGTGAEAMNVLCRFPQCYLLCVDNSPAMLSQFREKVSRAYGDPTAAGRVVLVEADFREPGWLSRAAAQCSLGHTAGKFDAALSVYALHHLSPELKSEIYGTIAQQLQADSLFINADLYGFATPWLDRLAQEEEEDWIHRQFDVALPHTERLAALLGSNRTRLKERWLSHIRDENVPLPVGSFGAGSVGLKRTCEEGLLRAAGFADIEVAARWFQSAVLVAQKRGSRYVE